MTDRKYPDYAQRLRDWICERLQGKCRIISEGDSCICALCDFDRMWQAARAVERSDESVEFCECDEQPTEDELATLKCAACGRRLL